MTTDLYVWAAMWSIPLEAIDDLRRRFGMSATMEIGNAPTVVALNEATVQAKVRLEAGRKGVHLFRNNVGALKDETGRWVRYGLCNDSPAMNAKIKSADLIGFRTIGITPDMIGQVVAQFVSRECKPPNWRYSGKDREPAQMRWLEIVTAGGGDAAFCTGEGSL